MKIIWFEEAWEDYLYWQAQDKKTVRRINQLLQDIKRNGYPGIGKPDWKMACKRTRMEPPTNQTICSNRLFSAY